MDHRADMCVCVCVCVCVTNVKDCLSCHIVFKFYLEF